MIVRPGTKDDAYEFMYLVKQMVKDVNYPFKVDMKKTLESGEAMVDNPLFFYWVAEAEGEVVGFLVAAVNQTIFSSEKIASELGWYIHPDHRKGTAALRLLKEYEKWADELECDYVTLSDVQGSMDMDAVYTRRGYKLEERTYVRKR